MKKIFILFILFAAGFCAFAQEKTALPKLPAKTEAELAELPPLLVNKTGQTFQVLENGEYRDIKKRKELNSILLSVPENEKLVKQAQGLYAGMWVCFGAALACVAVNYMNEFIPAFGRNENVALWSATGLIVTGCGGALCSMFSTDKYNRAADKYNLYVMGIPIPAK